MDKKALKAKIEDFEKKIETSTEYEDFYALAQAYFDDGQYEKVRDFIQNKLFIKFHENAQNYCLFAKALSNQGKYDEAISKVYKALELSPDDVESKITLGKILYYKGKFDAAFEIFQKLEEAEPPNSDFWRDVRMYLGLIYSQRNQQEKAIFEFKYIIEKINSRDIEAYFNMGLAYSILNWSKEAIWCYKEVFKLKPEHPEARYAIAYVHYQNKEFESAIRQLDAGIHMTRENEDLFWLKGQICFEKGKYNEAMLNFEQAIKANPENVKAYPSLAKTYAEMGLKDFAIEYYLMAIAKNPSNEQNYLEIAKIYEEKKAYDLAIKYYDMTIKKNEKIINGYIGLGYCHKQKKEYDKALGYFEKVCKLNANVPQIHFEIADLNKLKNDFEQAAEHYTESLNLKPNNPKAYYELGQIYKQKNDFDTAKLYLKEAISIAPNDSKSYALIGEIYFELGALKEAELDFKKALRFDGGNEKAIKGLLKLYKSQKKYSQAKKVLERFIKKNDAQYEYALELKELKNLTLNPILKFITRR